MTALYCEIDPFAAAWLRELIKAGQIAPGDVTETPLEDLLPYDVSRYTQVHLCAGIGVWSYALRNIGWSDDSRIWSASFPCQPFSAAGKGLGFADERHLWPLGLHLIQQCRPDVIVGEQVASKDGLAWFDVVQADLEASGYAVGAVDLCAAGVGAPHIRQRLWWVAIRLDHHHHPRLEGHRRGHQAEGGRIREVRPVAETGQLGGLAKHDSAGRLAGQRDDTAMGHGYSPATARQHDRPQEPGPVNGHWRDADWLFCRDGKWRPVEPGAFPLAHGAAARVGRLRGYGNAVVAQAAEEFLRAALADFLDAPVNLR
jgi:DNA (cytosine-5)-methyltransferase 1